tara:strand:- start:922 stop:1317 length:396 start_codon:yes stop_codon:yes gene_type:complete
MKKLILVFLFAPVMASSQWSMDESNDPLDGKVTTVIGRGYGGDFPYKNPKLVFRIKNEETRIYITDAGSLACDKPYLEISFESTKPNIYMRIGGDAGANWSHNIEFELQTSMEEYKRKLIEIGVAITSDFN